MSVRDNVSYLPRWKENSTAEEFFQECAHIARKHPEWCEHVAVVAQENDGTQWQHRIWRRNVKVLDAIAMMEIGKLVLIEEMRK